MAPKAETIPVEKPADPPELTSLAYLPCCNEWEDTEHDTDCGGCGEPLDGPAVWDGGRPRVAVYRLDYILEPDKSITLGNPWCPRCGGGRDRDGTCPSCGTDHDGKNTADGTCNDCGEQVYEPEPEATDQEIVDEDGFVTATTLEIDEDDISLFTAIHVSVAPGEDQAEKAKKAFLELTQDTSLRRHESVDYSVVIDDDYITIYMACCKSTYQFDVDTFPTEDFPCECKDGKHYVVRFVELREVDHHEVMIGQVVDLVRELAPENRRKLLHMLVDEFQDELGPEPVKFKWYCNEHGHVADYTNEELKALEVNPCPVCRKEEKASRQAQKDRGDLL